MRKKSHFTKQCQVVLHTILMCTYALDKTMSCPMFSLYSDESQMASDRSF